MFKFGHLLVFAVIVCILLGVMSPNEAFALRTQPRPDYMVGVGWGMGRGVFNRVDGVNEEYSEGGIPLIRVGRMIGSKAMVALNYSGWLIEFDERGLEEGDAVALFAGEENDSTIIKNRLSQQQLALSLYWFPGNPRGASGGVYLRAGLGMGWSGMNEVPITPGEPQGHGDRIDEWGWGVSAEGGYEFWVSSHATLGLGVLYNYMSIQDNIVEDGWFTGASMNFNIYF